MKKKLLVISFVFIMLLTACSDHRPSTDKNNNGIITITYYQPGLEDPLAKKEMNETIGRFEQKHPNIRVKVQSSGWDEAYQKLVTSFMADAPPDVFYGGTRWVTSFVTMKAVLPLDKYAKERLSLYPQPLQKAVQVDGKSYAIPRAFSARTLIYRSDLISRPPQTWEELLQTAKKVQAENKNIYGLGISGAKHVSTTTQFLNYLFQNGGEVFDEKGNVKLNSPEAVEALTFYADLYRKHKVVPNPLEYNREQLPILFKQKKIAMYVCGPWAKNLMAAEENHPNTPYKAAPLPKGKMMANTLVSDSLMISSKTKHPEAAWKFIEFITSPEEQKKHDMTLNVLPLQTEEAKDPFFNNDPYMKEFINMIKVGKPEPTPVSWESFEDILTTAIQKTFNGEDAQTALNEAVQKIKEEKLEPKR
ncbi:ABC transporter substrate-binding protein [Paenactinomyces guangxiensis]|uniref:Sugar ABC transporter substrate-binding protein n=1 Tax=Paenactinomyces guangxiensis TaxID=1490290 RepID=A0A7W1WQR9_9BACL|nr:sugar ABC transporter substrate-binding protein [Paenactinomyces guangxiensis]MBA4494352.1 sugar ABC transporter substrate-binding protein [Paenactinomyces guangxiensis]MBH8591593.1 sugar ABC transporter substrate-binding protein [Paenactinomyces guangxiensis]